MNALENYKKLMGNMKYANDKYGLMAYNGFINGFDAVINLDLPLKFAIWRDAETLPNVHYGAEKIERYYIIKEEGPRKPYTLKELYIHWKDNVYKPE